MNRQKPGPLHALLLFFFFAALLWSGVGHSDYFIWALEAAPGVLGVAFLALLFRRFRFTDLTYVLVLAHCVILFVGAKYTYAEVPLFNWLRDSFDMARNNYDKVGHFAQGFIPAFIAREALLRLDIVTKRNWLHFLVVCICLAASAVYELIEWFVAELTGESAEAFLGTQGYVWDTQSDMLCALLGACCMVFFFSGMHDRAIRGMLPPEGRRGI